MLVQGMNSGYQAINLAYMLGAQVVLLLGYVMTTRGQHFFGKHPPKLNNNTNYETFISAFENMNPRKHGLEVINCSVGTALTCFPKMDLDDALKIFGQAGSDHRHRALTG